MPATARSTRRICTALVAVVALLLLAAPGASAASKSFSAKRIQGRTAVFRIAGVSPSEVRRARLKVGGYRKGISASQARRAARRGKLRLRLPRKVARQLRRRGARLSRRGRRSPRLTVTTKATPGATRRGSPVREESTMGFETGNFSEASSLQAKAGGRLDVTGERAYQGSKSARATWFSDQGSAAQRVWKNTDWDTGTEVWYGMALYVPQSTDYCWWQPIRWDNYDVYGGTDDDKPGYGDVGGVNIEQDRLSITKGTYADDEQKVLDAGPMPKGRWVWLEVHQIFSPRDGQALSELYLDGHKRGASTKANTNGREITDLRAGAVSIYRQGSSFGSVDFDRVTISNSQRGPVR